MKIFITGDVHGRHDCEKIQMFRQLYKNELTLDDYLIICGDFGLIWDGGARDEELKNKFRRCWQQIYL